MNIISIDKNNIDSEHICCAIGNDKANQQRAASKKEWMKRTFKDARENGSPFGTLGVYYKGKLIMHELMPEKKFEKFLDTLD